MRHDLIARQAWMYNQGKKKVYAADDILSFFRNIFPHSKEKSRNDARKTSLLSDPGYTDHGHRLEYGLLDLETVRKAAAM